jgi:glycosyltransferase involved in cell wall biosynthesis
MRCAVVCPIQSGGGITEAFLTSLDMLRDQGITPIAIVPEGFRFLCRLQERSFETHRIVNLHRGGAINRAINALAIARAARRAEADVLVLNNGRFVPWVKWFLPTVPLVAIYHGGKVERFLRADRVITINDDQLEYLRSAGYPAESCVVVDNALPLLELPPYKPRCFKAGEPVVGTLRLLEHAKGVDVLIRAIALLSKRGKRYRTRIGSSGTREAALKGLVARLGVADLVEFCGWINDKDGFFDSLDIYVLPSRHEEWGIGIAEANAARLPVIATECLGPRRIIRDGLTGILVPVDDPPAMADAIESLASDPSRAGKLAMAAYDHLETHYLFPIIAPKFASEIMKALPLQYFKKK